MRWKTSMWVKQVIVEQHIRGRSFELCGFTVEDGYLYLKFKPFEKRSGPWSINLDAEASQGRESPTAVHLVLRGIVALTIPAVVRKAMPGYRISLQSPGYVIKVNGTPGTASRGRNSATDLGIPIPFYNIAGPHGTLPMVQVGSEMDGSSILVYLHPTYMSPEIVQSIWSTCQQLGQAFMQNLGSRKVVL